MSLPNDSNISAILDLYTYIGYENAKDGQSLKDIVNDIANNPQFNQNENYLVLKDAINNNSDIGNLRICGQSCNIYENDTINACAFTSSDGDVYVTFRGTGDGRWVDNGIAFGANDSPIQQEASKYFDYLCEIYDWDNSNNIIITGHSKGGNLSQYVTMTSENRGLIDACYSLDGQGFSPEAIERFKKLSDYDEQLDKLWSISGINDPINQLGDRLVPEDHVYYVKQDNVDSLNPFAYHELTNMLNCDGLNEIDPDGSIGAVAMLFKLIYQHVRDLDAEEREALSKIVMEFVEWKLGDLELSTAYVSDADILCILNLAINALLQNNATLAQVYNMIMDAIDKWVITVKNDAYSQANNNPDIYINTDSFWSLGCRIETVQKMVKQVEKLLDDVYWWNTSLSVSEYHSVGNANRRVGSTFKLGLCASYLFATAEEFNAIEQKYS